MNTSAGGPWRGWGETFLLLLVISLGAVVRFAKLDATPYWSDESESSINALTILQNGYPGDSYLGIPIYENTLTEPWPDHPEYEFRDSSYTNHMAVYHAWLPLYSIAASFALHGVGPDEVQQAIQAQHSEEDRKRAMRAGRFPAVIFGVLFLGVVFLAGSQMYGRDAGWAALVMASVHGYPIDASRQARYYSAEILLTTACCFAVWLMVAKGQWKHFLWGGLLFVLLFYTHILSFAAAGIMMAGMTPLIMFRHDAAFRKLAAFGTVVMAGTMPWILMTGFYAYQGQIPRGWSLLSLPVDLAQLPPLKASYFAVAAAFSAAAAWAVLRKPHWPERLRRPFTQAFWPLAFLSVWAAGSYACFLLLMPAASFFSSRLRLGYYGAMLLGAAVISASIARMLLPRFRAVGASFVIVGLAVSLSNPFGGTLTRYDSHGWETFTALFDYFDAMKLAPGTKLYAMPHMVLTFYSGLPFQSIWPVRRTFLDSYDGEIVLVDSGDFQRDGGPLEPVLIRQAAARSGIALPDREAETLSWLLVTRDYRERMIRITGGDASGLEEVPSFAKPLLIEARERRRQAILTGMHPALMLRGYDVSSWTEFEDVFLYRFVNPTARTGIHQNYASRLRGSTGIILKSAYKIVYRCPKPGGAHPAPGVRFEFVD